MMPVSEQNKSRLRTTTATYSEMGDRNLWDGYLRLRKSVFLDELQWGSLGDVKGLEIDEYDQPRAVYIVCTNGAGEIVGGARILHTDVEAYLSPMSDEATSYMIRDASLGRLDELPRDICTTEAPQNPKIIELTRLVALEPGVGAEILTATNNYMIKNELTCCLLLGRPAFLRMARMMGYSATQLGDVQGNASGRFVAFSCDVVKGDK